MNMPNEKNYPEPPDPNDHEKFGPLLLKEFDENPGDDIIDKGVAFGKRGLLAGGLAGAVHAAVFEPPIAVNGFAYALRHMGVAGALTGASGLMLGAGIPIAQAIRNKNDPMSWMMGGFAAGAVFALKSGSIGRAMKYGSFVAVVLGIAKATGTYQRPYIDPYVNLRKPKPDVLPLFDEDGNMIRARRM